MAKQKIGFIGLGAMGGPMAQNLIKNYYELTVYDVAEKAMEPLVEAGARVADSCAMAAEGAEVIITVLPSSPHVKEAVLSKIGILETIGSDAIYIDMSTIDPLTTQAVAKEIEAKGARMLDAPVTKGVKAAISGTLSIYVGGDEDVLEAVKPILLSMGTDIFHMGGISTGSTTKLVNALCLASVVGASIEAIVFGAKLGVDPDKLVEAVAKGSGSSRALRTHVNDCALKRDFDRPGFPVQLLMKDINLAMEAAKGLNMPLFFGSFAHEIYAMLKAKDKGKGFFPEIITIFEEYAGITVEGGNADLDL